MAQQCELVTTHESPARAGRYGSWPSHLDEGVIARLRSMGLEAPYEHQSRAMHALAAGKDVVIATSTASGKSLCYQLPIVSAVRAEGDARALLLFPTKALARDQMASMRRLAGPLGLGMGTYDGDTPPDERRATRARAHAVATNPDMLHRAILPNHDRWATLLASLRFVVLDEMHTYRGVFGSHVAHVLRRLLRLCAYHGARPQLVGCSATIANPRELMADLSARSAPDIELIDEDTAPRGARRFVVLNPAVVDPVTGVRRDYLKVTRHVTGAFRRAGVRTLAFCRTRKSVELLTRYLREDETAEGGGQARSHAVGRTGLGVGHGSNGSDARVESEARGTDGPRVGEVHLHARARAERAIRGYRGGYLPEHCREVERALREGEARVVATTNALELGMDIGGLDGVVLVGYPGTRAATWQRSGRAGRSRAPSLTALVLSSQPLDQCVAATPEFLFGEPPEHARIDPDNPEVLVPHLRCAAHEVPFRVLRHGSLPAIDTVEKAAGAADGPAPVDGYPGLDAEDLGEALDYLVEVGGLFVERSEEHDAHGRQSIATYHSVGTAFPADAVDLRGSLEENFEVIEERPGHFEHGRVLAEVDFADGPLYLHPGAIYPLEGRTYEVRRLDWEGRKAFVRDVRAHYYTEAVCELRVRVLEPTEVFGAEQGATTAAVRGIGYGQVVRAVPVFKKLRFRTHENIGFGPVNVPELDLQTSIGWWTPSRAWLAAVSDPRRRADAVLGASHVLHHVGAMVCMCDVRDLGRAVGVAQVDVHGEVQHPPGGGWAVPSRGSKTVELERECMGRPSLYLYDAQPGGSGLTPRLVQLGPAFLDQAIALVDRCSCAAGCPTCVGAEVLGQHRGPDVTGGTAHTGAVERGRAGPAPNLAGDALVAGSVGRGNLRADVAALLRDLRSA